ncbi:NAD(P)H-dependent oxidoreductase [Flavobacteriaceae bacterium XHP0103]|uniref:NAD(P)H-dependent oxidoreductase n=1 Tax=Marixanthotalea marina TaxID=2844359 RepID=UPI002989EE3E|nr:NAD(P)H-dependent oxidoreductase [Marixanthotalea marina]MBU3821963.1 NAD(P)H-dependent oxidoreductase [Marixanthotalea marina]
MTQTLVISYTPRKGSYTKVLFDEFVTLAKGKTKIKHLNLVDTPPDLLLTNNLNLIMEWNKGKRDFSEKELSILSNHHHLIEDVLKADNIVLAFPVYNFTMPATVKAWVDAIVVSDKTFSFSPETGFTGLCRNKKALSIIVGGFDYSSSKNIKEYATSTLKQNYDFMGISSEQISAFGVDQNRDQLDSILENAKFEIRTLVDKWFPN